MIAIEHSTIPATALPFCSTNELEGIENNSISVSVGTYTKFNPIMISFTGAARRSIA
jgi:hypothetical protein